jgi:hypothetical protein
MKLTKTQALISQDKRIESISSDSDGCWIYLKPGFTVNMGESTIVENTWAKAAAKLKNVRPKDCGRPHPQEYCVCAACVALK